MAISLDSLLAGRRPPYDLYKPSVNTEGAGTWQSLWAAAGTPIAGATAPAFTAGSGYVPTRATTGAIGQADATTGNLYVTSLSLSNTVAGKVIVYDRLWACSGLSTNSGAVQSVTTPGSLTAARLSDGVSDYSDVEVWLEVNTAPGATAGTWTVTALDGAGVSRAYTYAHPANGETVGQMMPLVPPSAATPGIQQVTSFQCSANSGAGTVGVVLLRRIAELEIPLVNVGAFKGALDLGLPEVKDGACLALMVQCTATSSGILLGNITLSEATP